jgi:TusA-related sulfurtransferase
MNTDKNLDAPGHACINLTPMIKQAMSALEAQQILKVSNDDPASRMGVPAWCRLTGHTLVEVKELDESQTEFYIQKKIF